jgi:hypothetical protein
VCKKINASVDFDELKTSIALGNQDIENILCLARVNTRKKLLFDGPGIHHQTDLEG